jgi:hypothetical protein
MHCEEFRSSLEAYLEDGLEADRRGLWRSHLGGCAGCREWALGEEPTLLLVDPPAPAAELRRVEACALAVRAQIRQQRTTRRLARSHAPGWLAAAAAAVLLLAAGVLLRPHVTVPPPATAGVTAAAAVAEPSPRLEVTMDGQDVRVYQFAVDEGDDLAVTFVVNPALES